MTAKQQQVIIETLDKEYAKAQNASPEFANDCEAYYLGMWRMAQIVISNNFTIDRSIDRTDGKHRIIDYRK